MKESHGKGLASHSDPESCVGGSNPAGEALTGEDTGREMELRNQESGVPTPLHESEGAIRGGAEGEPSRDPAESKALRMCGRSLHGNRETPDAPIPKGGMGRSEKVTSLKSGVYASGESDSPIVPEKPSNKGGRGCSDRPSAETAEGRGLAKRNAQQTASPGTQSPISGSPGLLRVREAARRKKDVRFTALLHHITPDLLRESFEHLQRKAAPGVDGVTWTQYSNGVEERLSDLWSRVHRGTYRAQPSKRAYIPKADGRRRPLGIAAVEDKIVQQAVVTVLNAIYEEDFLGFSYGFRPGRCPHDALDAFWVGLTERKVDWVLDADIRGFFDTLNHEWLMTFLQHRIADPRMLRLIRKWLKAGVSEDGEWSATTVGTPQGAVISPLLANVYLHYVLDLWARQWRNRHATGEVVIVRYADDFVLGFQHRSDAERFLSDLTERLRRFGLELHPDKTRLIEFGRFAAESRKRRGEDKPDTFDFLGFTHSCGKTRTNGKFTVLRKSIGQRMSAKLRAIRDILWKLRHEPVWKQGEWLGSVVRGWFNHHAVPVNTACLKTFLREVERHWFRALRRRDQKRRLNWERFRPLAHRWLPRVRILHPYPSVRFHARHPRQEPYAVIPPVRIRAGGGP
jgi:RNA-directed DNA polymerase